MSQEEKEGRDVTVKIRRFVADHWRGCLRGFSVALWFFIVLFAVALNVDTNNGHYNIVRESVWAFPHAIGFYTLLLGYQLALSIPIADAIPFPSREERRARFVSGAVYALSFVVMLLNVLVLRFFELMLPMMFITPLTCVICGFHLTAHEHPYIGRYALWLALFAWVFPGGIGFLSFLFA